jgi:hypothetical protein
MISMLGGIVGVWIQNFLISAFMMIFGGLIGFYYGIDS